MNSIKATIAQLVICIKQNVRVIKFAAVEVFVHPYLLWDVSTIHRILLKNQLILLMRMEGYVVDGC